jgi:hypothetical protein
MGCSEGRRSKRRDLPVWVRSAGVTALIIPRYGATNAVETGG